MCYISMSFISKFMYQVHVITRQKYASAFNNFGFGFVARLEAPSFQNKLLYIDINILS